MRLVLSEFPFVNGPHSYVSHCMRRLLSCAEEHHLPKRLNNDYGGGLKEFVKSEWNKFEGFGDEIAATTGFFTSQERQWLILRLLETLRSSNGDEIGTEKFVQGQAIGKYFKVGNVDFQSIK